MLAESDLGPGISRRESTYLGDQRLSSLDESIGMFTEFPANPPTFLDALSEMNIKNFKEIVDESNKCLNKIKKGTTQKVCGLTDDEVLAISCYTLDSPHGIDPIYKIINECLARSRNISNIKATRKYIYLLLSGLRKLPRYKEPDKNKLYHRVNTKVPTTLEEAKGHQFYAQGQIVTWWGFTSTSKNIGVTNFFVDPSSDRTLFIIKGNDLWGYDIQAFSKFDNEEEVLLEPETRVEVVKVTLNQDELTVNLEFQPSTHLALDESIPVKINGVLPNGWKLSDYQHTGKYCYEDTKNKIV